MGTGIKRAVLLCVECIASIYDSNTLVKGSSDSNDFRCPECGSALLNCGYCLGTANRFARIDGEVTWNCKDGCNP